MPEPTNEDRAVLRKIALEVVGVAGWSCTDEGSKDIALQDIADYREASYAKGVEDGKKAALKEVIRPISDGWESCFQLAWDPDIDEWVKATYQNATICGRPGTYWISSGSMLEPTHFANLPKPESVWGETI